MIGQSSGKPLHILHTIRSLRVDGVVKVLLRNLAHHDRVQFTHTVCAMRRDSDLVHAFEAQGMPPVVLDVRGPATIPRAISALVRLIRERQVDLVHTNRLLDLALAGTAARMCGIPVVSSVHWLGRLDDHPEEAHRSWLRRWSEMQVNVLLNRMVAHRVVAVSRAVRDSYGSLAGFPRERTVVIHPGLDMRDGGGGPEVRARVRAELGLEDSSPVLLNVGRLHPVKGQRQLIPVMRVVRGRLPRAVLLIAGDGELRDELRREITAAGLDEAIRLLGTRGDVDALLAASDLLVLASESEAAPLPLFEAMRAGRPVVATDVGGVSEIVDAGVTGHVVARGDADALAAGILRVLEHPDEAARMGEAGRRLGRERFDIRGSVRAIEQVYRELLSGNR